MKAWYCPSWHGDWRLEPDPDDPKRTRLSVERPTPAEIAQLGKVAPALREKKWIGETVAERLEQGRVGYMRLKTGHVTIDAPLSDVGPVVTSILQPGVAILTAVRFTDGRCEVVESNKPDAPDKPTEEVKELAAKPGAEKAATVKRPTPCCPACYVDAIGPATDVLLSFLDDEQHQTWAEHRFVIVRGGITRHRYLIAHRHSRLAAMQMRICFDLDDQQIMHFHDWTVPPEEEALAAMLILRHREPWLRNEATALGSHRQKLKNPFGDGLDGVADSQWTSAFGAAAARLLA